MAWTRLSCGCIPQNPIGQRCQTAERLHRYFKLAGGWGTVDGHRYGVDLQRHLLLPETAPAGEWSPRPFALEESE
jgi:hypothetical protein